MEQPLRRYRSSYDLTQCGILKENLFCSRWYRGLSPGMEWLRLTLDAPVAPQVRVFVADTPQQSITDLHPVLVHTANDLLLYGVRGQYLAFTAEPGAALLGFLLSFRMTTPCAHCWASTNPDIWILTTRCAGFLSVWILLVPMFCLSCPVGWGRGGGLWNLLLPKKFSPTPPCWPGYGAPAGDYSFLLV